MTRRISINAIHSRKNDKKAITALTASDAIFGRLLDEHVDILLVGDSLGMVRYGMASTLPVTKEMMIGHGKAVVDATDKALIVVDMPFASYQASPEQAFENAAEVLSATGAQAVKLEGGQEMAATVKFLTQRGIAVMGHVGLTPQHVVQMGGFRIQGRDDASRKKAMDDAKAIAGSGVFAMVVEGVVESLAEKITQQVNVPTIGIGASAKCDGQILVTEDLLGLSVKAPKFAKQYCDVAQQIQTAAKKYASEVETRSFPTSEFCYQDKK